MRLCLKDEELELQLEITNWYPLEWDEQGELIGYPWCRIDMPIKTHYLDYNVRGEVFERGELLGFRDMLKALLQGELKEDTHCTFIEPDLEFYLYPEYIEYSNDFAWYKGGSKTYELSMEMKVNFWMENGALGAGEFTYPFSIRKIKELYHYLQLVTGELREDGDVIQRMIKEGVLIPSEMEKENPFCEELRSGKK